MLDTHARKYFEPIMTALAKYAVKNGISANKITLLAFIIGVGAGIVLYFKLYILAIIMLWISGLLDAIDGNVARFTNTQSLYGAQLDIISDRIVELAILWGLVLNHQEASMAMLLLVSCILISMTVFLTTGMIANNSGKKSFYYQAGLMERTEGFIMSTLMIVFNKYLNIFTYIYAVLILFTIIQRLLEVKKLIKNIK